MRGLGRSWAAAALCVNLAAAMWAAGAERGVPPAERGSGMVAVLTVRRSPDGADCAPAINRLLAEAPDGARIEFEAGEYLLAERLLLKGKRGIVLDGRGCTLVPRNRPDLDYRHSVDVMHFEGCRDLVVRDFRVRSEHPSNSGGRFAAVGADHADLQFCADPPLTGRERFIHGALFTATGSPTCCFLGTRDPLRRHAVIAGEFATSAPELVDTPHERLGVNRFRIPWFEADRYAKPGDRFTVKHFFTGLSGFVFRDCEDVRIDSVYIRDWGGFAFVVLPRCRDFVFRNLVFKPDDPERTPYSNALDAIHTTGLGGRLLVENCFFEGVGDDILNCHTQVLKVAAADGGELTLVFDKPHALFPKRWGRAGDAVRIHDGRTLALKAVRRIAWIHENRLALEGADPADGARTAPGDYLVNTCYCPEIAVRNCVAVNCRSRFCIQAAEKAEISGCRFCLSDMGSPVYVSSAFHYWGEAGCVRDVSIHDNLILRLREPGEIEHGDERSGGLAIWVRMNERGLAPAEIRNRHRNIRIRRNRIIGRISVSHTDGVEISGNLLGEDPEKAILVDKATCTDVRIEDNHHVDR